MYIEDMLIDERVIKPSLQQTLIKRHISRILIDYYNGDEGHNINQNTKFIGFGLIHYSLIRNFQPKNILCIGSRLGYIPAVLALACKDNNMGHVDFVDAGYDQERPTNHWSGIGFWKKIDPVKHFNRIGVSKYITTHVMTTLQYSKIYPYKKYQYIYIDGDHSYEGVTLDYKLFWPKLNTFGIMAFHDIIVQGYLDKGLFGVWKFWKKLKLKHKHSLVIPFPKESGLGIIQKL